MLDKVAGRGFRFQEFHEFHELAKEYPSIWGRQRASLEASEPWSPGALQKKTTRFRVVNNYLE